MFYTQKACKEFTLSLSTIFSLIYSRLHSPTKPPSSPAIRLSPLHQHPHLHQRQPPLVLKSSNLAGNIEEEEGHVDGDWVFCI